MLTGAFFGIWGSVWSGSWVVGLLMAMLFGGLLALIHAFFSIHLRADQIVSGFAVNFLALGLTGYLYSSIYPGGIHADVSRVPQVGLGFLDRIPAVGDLLDGVFGRLNLLVWVMFAVVILAYVVLFKTPIGLRIRSVGEHPRAADTVGISVYGVRYAAVVTSGVLAALGGAFLSIGFVGSFAENMTSGRGYIALAAVIFGKWRPGWAFAACLLFGFGFALAIPLQREADVSENLVSAFPYLLTLVALVGLIGRSIPPAAIGRPYVKQ
jgi:general nucleoside transport system permease protein